MGEALFNVIIEQTGLPQEPIAKELEALIQNAGMEKKDLTLDELREVLAEYLQDVMLEMKSSC